MSEQHVVATASRGDSEMAPPRWKDRRACKDGLRAPWNWVRRLSLPISAVSLLCLLAGCATVSKSVVYPGDGFFGELEGHDIAGRVLDTDGKAVRGAEVLVFYCRGEDGLRSRLVGKAVTDRQGAFVLDKAVVWEPITETKTRRKPDYAVIARHPDKGMNFTVVAQEDPLDDVKVELLKAKPHEVTVRDVDGNPIEGAKVTLVGGGRPMTKEEKTKSSRDRIYLYLYHDIGLGTAYTDTEGKAALIAFAKSYVWVDKDGYTRQYADHREEVSLFPSARVSGKVALDDGTPVPGAAVWFGYHGNRLIWDSVAVTDEEGRYVFENVPGAGFYYAGMDPESEEDAPGRVTVLAEDLRPESLFVAKQVEFNIKPGDDVTKDIVLGSGCVFAGKVIDLTTGKPVPRMRMNRSFGGDWGEITTDEDGRFSATVAPGAEVQINPESSPDGNYIIDDAWRRQGNYAIFTGAVGEDMPDLELKVKLWDVNELMGRVIDEGGAGVEGATVYIHSEAPGVKTEEDGAFSLKVAPKDRDFDLFAVTEDKGMAGLIGLQAGATEATIALEPTQDLEGEVVNTEGLPAGDLKFYMDLRINDGSLYRVRVEPTTDVDGRFTAGNLYPKGKYSMFWSSDNEDNRDYDYGNAQVDLAKLEPGDPIRFEAKQFLNALMGRVVNEKGEPIEGAQIQVATADMRQQSERDVKIVTNAKGEFVMPRLAGGDVAIKVTAEAYRPRTLTTPSDNIDFEAVLKPKSAEGTLYAVTVLDEDGNPIPRALVKLLLTLYDEKGQTSSHTQEARTNAQGKTELVCKLPEDVRHGRGIIGCDLKGYCVAYRGVQANEDDEFTLVLAKEGEPWTGRVVDQENNPIAGATVEVAGMNAGDRDDFRAFASLRDLVDFSYTTDEKGRFELTRFSKQHGVSLEARAEGYSRNNTYLSPDPERPAPDTITLLPGGTVKGRIVAKSTGEPLSGFQVMLRTSDRGSEECKLADDGTFSAIGLRPGKYEVYCGAKPDAGPELRKYVLPSRPSVIVEAGETAEVVIEMEEGIPVRGSMVAADNGKLPDGRKSVHAQVNNENAAYCQVQDDGSWDLYLWEGTFDLKYHVEGFEGVQDFKSITVEKGEVYEGLVIEVDMSKAKTPENKA